MPSYRDSAHLGDIMGSVIPGDFFATRAIGGVMMATEKPMTVSIPADLVSRKLLS